MNHDPYVYTGHKFAAGCAQHDGCHAVGHCQAVTIPQATTEYWLKYPTTATIVMPPWTLGTANWQFPVISS